MAAVANGKLHGHIKNNWMYDALIIGISSSKVRYGLVGIMFYRVKLGIINE